MELNHWNRDGMACKAKNINYLYFYIKSWLTSIVPCRSNPLFYDSTLHMCPNCASPHVCLSPTISSAGLSYPWFICYRLKLYFLQLYQSQIISLDMNWSFSYHLFNNGYLNMSIFITYVASFILL